MSLLVLIVISFSFISFLFPFFFNKLKNDMSPTDWPILGMLPGLTMNLHRVYDWVAEVLVTNNLTFLFKGPRFARMDMLLTVDPANIHYIMSSNFLNFPKGSDFKEIFDVFGDGIMNADSDLWKNLRRSGETMFSHYEFQRFLVSTSQRKLEKGLIPLLDHAAEKKKVINLQDIFQRFTFDITSIFVTGYDPKSLSMELPEIELAKALDHAEEAIFYRHVKPKILWKLQRWLAFGEEKNMRKAYRTLDGVLAKYISMKREEIRRGIHPRDENGEKTLDLLSYYMSIDKTKYPLLNPDDDKFLRDMILNFMIAGRDTTSSALTWFFWLLSKNPEVLTKIRQEIQSNLPKVENQRLFDSEYMKNLVYLHGALCETLRLYPPVPFQHKSPLKSDILPSGHQLNTNTKVLFPLYALGRMASVWGEDAMEFKPERWITERGGVKHEPSNKFLAFNAGPRTCLGKTVALTQMKAVAVEMIQNYDVKVVEGQSVEPCVSIILHMKHGLKVALTKRSLL